MIAPAIVLALVPVTEIAAFGTGARSCGTALAEENYASSYAWVMGYFTGFNTALGSKTGHSTDGDGIMAEVQLLCHREPNSKLIDVVERVYLIMRDSHR
jgi:hypothetical protein